METPEPDNEELQSEEYYAELAVHRSRGDANAANAEGTIYPRGEPIEATGQYADRHVDEDE
ncbi:MAG TPA: hypothetical protein VFB58_11195 [Chloroflexota bacterium]|nr:hypothetical protein [Chloroflexota bacterium]